MFLVGATLGTRQSGKTTLARQLEFQHYFDLENPRDLARLAQLQLKAPSSQEAPRRRKDPLMPEQPRTLRVHTITRASVANGPGARTVVHTQGCSIRCPGCFNPKTFSQKGGRDWTVEEVLKAVRDAAPDGVTISGGEPTDQLDGILELCRSLRHENYSVLMFSGRVLEEIQSLPGGMQLLESLDVLIDGPFDAACRTRYGLCGSANQRIHLLTPRHSREELDLQEVEILIDPSGQVRVTGFPSPELTRAIRRGLG